jgi:hypothetical protein
MMKQYLRAFCNYEQDNWVELLPIAEFTYNNAIHPSSRMTPFWANYNYHLVMKCKALKQPSSLNSEIQAAMYEAGLEETHQTLRKNLKEAQANQRKYAGGNEVVFKIGDDVWHSTRHFRTARESKKLDYQRTEPYTVIKVINKNDYKLDLPYTIRKHNTSHISSLDRSAPPTAGEPPSGPQQTVVNDSDEWEVDRMLNSKRCCRKLQYLTQWVGYTYIQTSWEPAENVRNAQELVDELHREHPRKPQQ